MKLVVRNAVRAILVTPDKEILLMRIRNPVTHNEFWICPGGGRNEGEDERQGLARELREELGLTSVEARHVVWKRHHTFDWNHERISQHEVFFLVELPRRFAPVITDPEEAKVLQEFRWWTSPQLQATSESVAPRALAQILSDYWEKGPPQGELSVETLVD
jgi:8-oxo-dGTP pyrophosphatase MutT (NUDIX family)